MVEVLDKDLPSVGWWEDKSESGEDTSFFVIEGKVDCTSKEQQVVFDGIWGDQWAREGGEQDSVLQALEMRIPMFQQRPHEESREHSRYFPSGNPQSELIWTDEGWANPSHPPLL